MAPLISPTITIRPAYADDRSALVRLAALDSAEGVPEGKLLLAEVDGELRAALALGRRSVLADPFSATADVVALLHRQADAMGQSRGFRRWQRARRRIGLRALRAAG